MTRNGPETDVNKKFVGVAKAQWLKRVAGQLPKKLLDKSWPNCPVVCEEVWPSRILILVVLVVALLI